MTHQTIRNIMAIITIAFGISLIDQTPDSSLLNIILNIIGLLILYYAIRIDGSAR